MDKEYIETLLKNVRDYYYFFRENIKNYGFDGFLNNFNIEYMHGWFLENIPEKEYILFVTLGEKDFNKLIQFLKNYPDIFLTFIKNSEQYYSFFGYCKLDSFKTIFDSYKEYSQYCDPNFIKGVSSDILLSYIEEYADEEDIVTILNYSYSVREPFFSNDKRAYDLIKSGKISPNLIVHDNIKVSYEIATTKEIFNALKSSNIVDFRRKFNDFIEVNPYFELEDILNKYEESIIEGFDISTALIKPFNDIKYMDKDKIENKINDKYLLSFLYELDFDYENIEESLKKISIKKVSELIIDRLFKDNIYNVIININEMLSYQEEMNENLLDNDTMNFYKRILDYDNLSIIEKINIYNKYKNSNINIKFYEDLYKCRIHSYNNIKNKLYVPNIKNEFLSKKAGTDVYYLDGEEFNMLVRGLSLGYSKLVNKETECFSLIGTDNIETVDNEYLYGYYNVDTEKIFHVYENDAFSSDIGNGNSSKRINRIMTPEKINSYSGYSEIQIKVDGKVLEPDYVVSLDKITKSQVNEAKRLGIPIVLINTQKYNKNELKESHFLDDRYKYVNNSYDENDYKRMH